jgi:bifunctional oligoribonuclease and PAP phosphatase NrnA
VTTGPTSEPPAQSLDADGSLESAFSDAVSLIESVVGSSAELALACHINPDGDALGSTLAMHHLCRANGVNTVVSWPHPLPVAAHYRSVPGVSVAVASEQFPSQPSVMFTFDCGSLGRLAELAPSARWAATNGSLVVVDHHVSNDRYGTVNLVDTSAAATAVVVRELTKRLGWSLSREAAWCLYTGIVTDSGRFSYACTTPALFALAEELSEFDLPIADITRELFDEHSFAYVQLAASVLARAELDISTGLVASWVSQDDLRTYGVEYDECEGMIDWLRTTAEAEVACLCKEAADGVRVSLRAKSAADVGALAMSLGGGGHRLAAGFSMAAPIPDVLAAVRAALRASAADSIGPSSGGPGFSRGPLGGA